MFFRRAFTLIELLVTISILGIISWYIFFTIANLFEEWEKNKAEIKMHSESSSIINMISDHIYNSDEIQIIKSSAINDTWNKNGFYWLLIKTLWNKDCSSLFSLVKPLSRNLTKNEIPIYPSNKNYFVWITNLNLFSDIEYDNKNKMIIYSDPWNSSINFIQWNNTWILIWWDNSILNTPTWLYLSENHLFISDANNNIVFSIERDIIMNSDLFKRNNSLKIIAWKKWISWFSDGDLWLNTLNKPMWITFYDWNLYIVDSWNNSIRVLSLDWLNLSTYIWSWQSWISEDNSFPKDFLLNSPTDIDYSAENNLLFLTDTNNNRIVSFWPISWDFSHRKPFTIAWIWKLANFNLDKNSWIFFDKNKDNKKNIINENLIWKPWFSWDNSLATSAQFNHPTWIKVLNKSTLIVSDSWNNLIRKIYAPNYWQWWQLLIANNENLIESIIWNKIKLDIPTWITILDNSIIIIANNYYWWNTNNTNWKLLKYEDWNLTILNESYFSYINIDKIFINNVDDFVWLIPIDFMMFSKTNDSNSLENSSMIKLSLWFIRYINNDNPITTNINTSISQRKILNRK